MQYFGSLDFFEKREKIVFFFQNDLSYLDFQLRQGQRQAGFLHREDKCKDFGELSFDLLADLKNIYLMLRQELIPLEI